MLRTIFSAKLGLILKALVREGLLQRGLFKHSPARWAIHALIFWPFVIRGLWGVIGLIASLAAPEWSGTWVLLDKNHPVPALLFDLTGLSILLGAGLALARRLVSDRAPGRPSDLPGQDRLAVFLLAGLVVVGFLLEGLRLALTLPPGGQAAVVGWAISLLFKGSSGLTGLYPVVWYIHAGLMGVFVAYLPFSRMFHILTAPVAAALAALEEDRHHRGKN